MTGTARADVPGGADPPPPPAIAAAVFGVALEQAQRYVARLAGDGVARGLIGPREVPRLWERHVLNSAAVAEVVPPGAHVVDVGSGAGLPGIPLGLARPDLRVTLVEPMARRVEFLDQVLADLRDSDADDVHDDDTDDVDEDDSELVRNAGSPRWRVVRGRAEERSVVTAVGRVDVVTARAVAPLPRLVGWCRGLLRPGAQLIALVGQRAVAELPAALPELSAAGMRDVHVRAVGGELGPAATTVVVMTRGQR